MNELTATVDLGDELQETLLAVARESIQYGVSFASPRLIDPNDFPQLLQQPRASFVTIKIESQLRGCMGSLMAQMALVSDVAQNAYSSAFRDPRFPSISLNEFHKISISISVLNPAEQMEFGSEEDLLGRIQPKIDGLILRYKQSTGTFLPVVWESIPDPAEFLKNLKVKAGLSPDFWSDEMTIERFSATCF